MNIKEKLNKTIVKIADNETSLNDINNDTVLTTDLGFDSVKIIELIVELENIFNISFDDEDLEIENLTVYHSLNNLIRKKLK